ncbi:hypothetical protein [Klebsiella michiganensis]|uniref:hypothetical protein n=1 Tax=Klebsiella michiganensis TaxID=1134687 RepID=UPI001D0DF624|nr:hypothetical protein [Klebsiella michiganensis]
MEQIIGIDLAKRVFQVNIVSAQGRKKANKMINREKLMAFHCSAASVPYCNGSVRQCELLVSPVQAIRT